MDDAMMAAAGAVIPRLGYVLGGGVWDYTPGDPVGLPPDGSLPRVLFDGLRSRGYKWTSALAARNLNVSVACGKTPAEFGAAASALEALNAAAIVLPVTRAIPPAIASTNVRPLLVVKTYDDVLEAEIAAKNAAGTDSRVVGLMINTRHYALQLLNLLQQVVPGLSTVAVLYHDTTGQGDAHHPQIYDWIHNVGVFLGINVQPYPVTSPPAGGAGTPLATQIDDQLAAIAAATADAVLVVGDGPITNEYDRITGWAKDPIHQVPTLGTNRQFAGTGGLIAFGPDEAASFRRAAAYADMLLHGVTPANLGREYVGWWDLAINTDTAKAVGVTIPTELLYAATARFPGGKIDPYILPILQGFLDLLPGVVDDDPGTGLGRSSSGRSILRTGGDRT
jgi:putative tryptophan/tyrosine transport system substrate-binding protein